MRYSRMNQENGYKKTSGSGGKGAVVMVVIIVAAAAVYLIGAAKVGSFISDKVITPVISYFTGEEAKKPEEQAPSGAPSEDNADKEANADSTAVPTMKREVSFEEYPSYFLQIGVFEDRGNAVTLAEEMQEKGCAGYIDSDGEKYRVFIAGYPNRADAENVQQRIVTDYEMDTKIYELANASVTVSVETEEAVLDAIESSADDMQLYLKNAVSISQKFDKRELTKEDALKETENLLNLAAAKKNSFAEYKSRTDNALIASIYSYYDSICAAFSINGAELSDTELSADIKAAYIASCIAYNKLLSEIS